MDLTEHQQNQIRAAVNSGRTAHHTEANRTILAIGPAGQALRSYMVLAGHDGELTPFGTYYYGLTHETPADRTFDYNQPITRRGDTEYIKDRTGNEVKLRTLGPSGDFSYTAMGKKYYAAAKAEYVVQLPVIIEGHRSNGIPYTRHEWMPFDKLGVGRIMQNAMLTEAQRIARVKTYVLQQLGERTEGGRTVVQEGGEEVWYYNRDGAWKISKLSTTTHDGAPDVSVQLRRPLGALQLVGAAAFLPYPDQILDVAWEVFDDKFCIPRQLAVLLKQPMEDIIEEFDRLTQREWHEEGLTPFDVRAFCVERQLAYYCVGQGMLLDTYRPQAKGRGVAFAMYGGHAYFYKSARCVSTWTVRDSLQAATESRGQSPPEKLQGETISNTPPVSTWEPYEGPKPGNFYHSDLDFVRKRMLESGRNPRIVLRSLAKIGSLRYQCVQGLDGSKGLCVVREMPLHSDEITEWLANLKRTSDVDVEFCGERLPAITQKVLLQLLKIERRTPKRSSYNYK